jgi:redox-sensitive bicupin YhaK (pirin superfamily)
MIKKLPKENMYLASHGWLKSRFHFSFAEYRNFDNVNFGVLRVLNDDYIQPHTGFDTHPHQDMEIVTYIINGELTHADSMGNKESLYRGEVQYMSAGTGITHSEHNMGDEELSLFQIWILPPKKGLKPTYGSHRYTLEDREDKLLNIVSSHDGDAKIKLYQDVNFYVSEAKKGKTFEFDLKDDRQIYFAQIEGTTSINEIELNARDAMEIVDESTLKIETVEDSHFLFIEMAKAE